MRACLCALVAFLPALAVEKAAYDSNGRIIAMLSNAEDLEVTSNVVAVLPNGKRIPLQTRREGRGASRKGDALVWSASFQLPDGGRGELIAESSESSAGVRYSATLTAETALDVSAVELVLDFPRMVFLNGSVTPAGGAALALSPSKPAGLAVFAGNAGGLALKSGSGAVTLDVALSPPAPVALVDRWDSAGRSWQVRAAVVKGPLAAGAKHTLVAALTHTITVGPVPPAKLSLDTAKPSFRFDGFGGNYCWNNASPAAAYTIENLKVAWGRSEMKVIQWDKQRDNPGPELQADYRMMQRFHKLGIPWVISIWWLPERFYTDAYEKPKPTHWRIIRPEKWDELLDLLGSYLLYAKQTHGVEPDLFSFNEANIGVYVGQTPEAHTDAIKRIGAHFRKIGLKTKMLLGDATGPRDTHKFALDAASDPEAMQYVGAIGFHSWGGGSPEQYAAWGDLGDWLKLPLLVTELGVDAAAYNARAYDSYHYGLREAKMTQELLMYARPQGTHHWQFTNDYALVRTRQDGTVEPTWRFFLMKHFTDLTPAKSEGLSTSSDQRSVLFTAFRKGSNYTLHILNVGPARTVEVSGAPVGEWQVTQTTESNFFEKRGNLRSLRFEIPARSLTTLTATLVTATN